MLVETRNQIEEQVLASKRVSSSFGMLFVCFLIVVLGVTLGATPVSRAQAPKWEERLPEGEGKDIVAADCVLCHTLERVVISHRPRGEWDKLVNQMIERGAPLADDQVPVVVKYLAKNFGPGSVNAPAASGPAPVAAGTPKNSVADPEQAQFIAVPDALGLPKEVQMSVVTGDPLKGGPFQVLLKIPAGIVIPSHAEGSEESVVAIRGTFEFGEGDNFDAGKLQALKPQTATVIPAGTNNFGRAKEAAIISISGTGPISFGRGKSN